VGKEGAVTERVREQMIAGVEKHFDLPAFLASRGFIVPNGARDPRFVEMVQRSSGETLLLMKDLASGAWSYQNAHHPEDHGRASHYLEAHDRLTRDKSLDKLIALSTDRSFGEEALAYRRARSEKAPALREQELRHTISLYQERSTKRLLDASGVDAEQLEGGRFGRCRTPSDLDRLVGEPRRIEMSAFKRTDEKVVLIERPLDAIGYERVRGGDRACYLYTGSTLTPEKLRDLAQVIADIPAGSKIVLAFGRDEQGRELADRVQALGPNVKMNREPPELGARWADQMQIEQKHLRSLRRSPSRDLYN
jgi:hypothetical protein